MLHTVRRASHQAPQQASPGPHLKPMSRRLSASSSTSTHTLSRKVRTEGSCGSGRAKASAGRARTKARLRVYRSFQNLSHRLLRACNHNRRAACPTALPAASRGSYHGIFTQSPGPRTASPHCGNIRPPMPPLRHTHVVLRHDVPAAARRGDDDVGHALVQRAKVLLHIHAAVHHLQGRQQQMRDTAVYQQGASKCPVAVR